MIGSHARTDAKLNGKERNCLPAGHAGGAGRLRHLPSALHDLPACLLANAHSPADRAARSALQPHSLPRLRQPATIAGAVRPRGVWQVEQKGAAAALPARRQYLWSLRRSVAVHRAPVLAALTTHAQLQRLRQCGVRPRQRGPASARSTRAPTRKQEALERAAAGAARGASGRGAGPQVFGSPARGAGPGIECRRGRGLRALSRTLSYSALAAHPPGVL